MKLRLSPSFSSTLVKTAGLLKLNITHILCNWGYCKQGTRAIITEMYRKGEQKNLSASYLKKSRLQALSEIRNARKTRLGPQGIRHLTFMKNDMLYFKKI